MARFCIDVESHVLVLNGSQCTSMSFPRPNTELPPNHTPCVFPDQRSQGNGEWVCLGNGQMGKNMYPYYSSWSCRLAPRTLVDRPCCDKGVWHNGRNADRLMSSSHFPRSSKQHRAEIHVTDTFWKTINQRICIKSIKWQFNSNKVKYVINIYK